MTEPVEMIHDCFSLDHAEATFSCPRHLSIEDYEDVTEWLQLIPGRLKRWVKEPEPLE